MSLNDIQNTAALARLTIDQTQEKRLVPQLENIFEMATQIGSVNTDGTEPIAHPLGFPQSFRKDEVTEINQRACFQKNAYLIEEGLYIVPKIIEDE